MRRMQMQKGRSSAGLMDIYDMTALLAGSIVLGLWVGFAGLFLNVLAVVASFVYGPVITFRMFLPLEEGEELKPWG